MNVNFLEITLVNLLLF
ncbi:hypothetical protein Gotri_000968 [Gossypium trilobum]|uniref:Uncharacterized protein n=1 Tax=Gossypium trilobum TaxID=34281 RepID=A0A7J9FD22_9ROSI|nr:hypothetical protein [Gossypium trilobum]